VEFQEGSCKEMDILRVTIAIIFSVAILTVQGCGKDADKKQKFVVGDDMMNLTEADTMLSGSADEAVELVDNSQQAATDLAVEVPVTETPAPAAPVMGDTPEDQAIQAALKDLGLYTGDIDGKIGPKTRAAIREFQGQNGLVVDGKVGPKTWSALKNAMASKSQTQP
jgi:murein L,D-transpeptidase YcbB/YkuD